MPTFAHSRLPINGAAVSFRYAPIEGGHSKTGGADVLKFTAEKSYISDQEKGEI